MVLTVSLWLSLHSSATPNRGRVMKYLKPIVLSGVAVLALSLPLPVFAANANVPVYNPPPRGAPGGRVGGGTRGPGQRDVFVLSVLAPDHSGLTSSEQPSLYWFI